MKTDMRESLCPPNEPCKDPDNHNSMTCYPTYVALEYEGPSNGPPILTYEEWQEPYERSLDDYMLENFGKCGCEHVDHFDDMPYEAPTPQTKHDYLVETVLTHHNKWVGEICADCATNCLKDYQNLPL